MPPNHALRRARERQGWSQAHVARELGTDARTIGRWERGTTRPTPHFRTLLCQFYQVDIEELGLLEPTLLAHLENSLPTTQTASVKHGPVMDSARPRLSIPSDQVIGQEVLLDSLFATFEKAASCTIHGLPGVGKTTLAQLVSLHPRRQELFPDGFLWVSLGPAPDVHGELLRLAAILEASASDLAKSHSIQELSKLVHRLLGKRRLLIVIDDAWSVDVTLPFLIGGSQIVHLVTTRLPEVALALPTDKSILVPELDSQQSWTLLTYLVPQLTHHAQDAEHSLLQYAGGLPLAITLLGRYLRLQSIGNQPRRLTAALTRLADTHLRLHITAPQTPPASQSRSLDTMIAISDEHLPVTAQQALHALSILPAKPARFSEAAALAVTAQDIDILDLLQDIGLLETADDGWYMLHQTIHDYGLLHLEKEEPWARLVQYALHRCNESHEDNIALTLEHSTLLLALEAAITRKWHQEQVLLTFKLHRFWATAGYYALAEQYVKATLPIARLLGDARREGWMIQTLGIIADIQGHCMQAEQYFEEGLVLVQSMPQPDIHLKGALINGLAEVAFKRGKLHKAWNAYQEALSIARTLKLPLEEGTTLQNLGRLAMEQGRLREAELLLRSSLFVLPTTSMTIHCLSQSCLGDILSVNEAREQEALESYQYAQALDEEADPLVHCRTYLGLGELARRHNQLQEATTLIQQGLHLAQHINLSEETIRGLRLLGLVAIDDGALDEAHGYLHEALSLSRRSGYVYYEAACVLSIGMLSLTQRLAETAEQAFKEVQHLLMGEVTLLQVEATFGCAQLAALQGRAEEAQYLAEQYLHTLVEMHHTDIKKAKAWLDQLSPATFYPQDGTT